MEILREKQTRSLWEKVFIFVGLVIAATLINIGGSQLCAIFGLPLYLDSIGTMLAASLGGYLPSITIGLFSPFVNSIATDPSAISYGMLADMVESRDQNTGDHIRKTAEYVKLIMEEMRREGIYADELTDRFVADVESAAPLHDIGKISVSDVILNKPGKLTDEEFEIMKTHTTMGAKIIDQVIDTVPDADSYLMEARRLALYHHEKWNGQGYPQGLSGEEIPLSARIMAVADVFDALVSKRAYKDGFPFEKAMDIIRESSGSHFDPQVAQAFINAETKVREVAERNSTFSSKG